MLLFYVLMMGHPLLGRRELEFECWDNSAESVLFGNDARFIFDPNDESNRPVPDLHATVIRYWELYPEFLRSLFVQAFTRGLNDPKHGRVRESMWRVALARLSDSIVDCPACGRQNFVSGEDPTTLLGVPRAGPSGRDLHDPRCDDRARAAVLASRAITCVATTTTTR